MHRRAAGRRALRAGRTRELRVVGVTGSTGKTSTKDLLAAALPDGAAYASPESYNNEFGLPITLLNAPAGVPRSWSPRWGSASRATSRCCATSPDPSSAIVTNVGLAHAEHLGGREGVAAVLAELLEALPESGAAVLNADDEWTPWLAQRTDARASRRSGYAPDAGAPDHAMSTSAGRCIPSSRSTAAASGSGSAARTR